MTDRLCRHGLPARASLLTAAAITRADICLLTQPWAPAERRAHPCGANNVGHIRPCCIQNTLSVCRQADSKQSPGPSTRRDRSAGAEQPESAIWEELVAHRPTRQHKHSKNGRCVARERASASALARSCLPPACATMRPTQNAKHSPAQPSPPRRAALLPSQCPHSTGGSASGGTL